jgi:DNA-binding PadR family transcriptional regulator
MDRGEAMNIREHDDLELMSMRRLSDSLEATRMMLLQAQKITQDTQSALISLATEFCGQELQKRQEENEDLYLLSPEELAAMLRSRFKSLKLSSSNGAAAQLSEANRILGELRSELESQRSRADQAQLKVNQLEKQVHVLERTLENEHQARQSVEKQATHLPIKVDQTSDETAVFETWFTKWQAENHNCERDREVIITIGKTGLSLSTEIEEAVAKEKEISPRTIRRAFVECVKEGLLEKVATASIEGRPPRDYTLTDKGKWLYRVIAGEEPKASARQGLLKAHRSDRHLALILKTAEKLTELGYEVEQEPLRMQLEEKRFYLPDLVVKKDNETFYLEVETGEKEKQSLSQKWGNAIAATGRICVTTDNMATLRRIQGSIAQWSVFEGRRVKLYITSLVTLREKKIGDSPWYAIKEYTSD